MATSKPDPLWPGIDTQLVLAAKEIANKGSQDNYLIIKFKYYEIVLPYKEGCTVLQNLKNAEYISDKIAYDYKKIVPIDFEDKLITSQIISKELYVEMKMRHILKLTEKPNVL